MEGKDPWLRQHVLRLSLEVRLIALEIHMHVENATCFEKGNHVSSSKAQHLLEGVKEHL